jgi:uncharacterized protein (DUF427 family)
VSLTSGKGPLSARRAGRFTAPVPEGLGYVEPFRRRVRAVVGGRTVIDTERALLVHRAGAPPLWAFAPGDVDSAAALGAVEVPEAPGHLEVPWGAADAWYQEEDEVLLHAPNPYHRVECVRSARRVRVEVAGTVLVDTADTLAVYETALEPRLYVHRDQVRCDLLVPSATTSHCPYKGDASWWRAVVDGTEVADVAWSYEDPLPESAAIARMLSFDEAVARVTTDLPPPAPV